MYERTNKKGKTEYVYATAGTDDIHDVKTDAFQSFYRTDAQYGRFTSNARGLAEGLEGRKLSFTGHSLGGGLASANALATGKSAITFNAAGVGQDTKDRLGLFSSARIDAYVVEGEIVSVAQSIVKLQADGNIHALRASYGIQNSVGRAIIQNYTLLQDAEAYYEMYQRVINHTMGVVLQKLVEQGYE